MSAGPYLLDTHVILWIFGDSSLLSKHAASAIRKGELIVSVASFWEVVIKSRKGQLDVLDPVPWWDRVVRDLNATVLSIRQAHVVALAPLAQHHNDPFDRIMIAQVIAEGYTMITSDSAMNKYPVKTLW